MKDPKKKGGNEGGKGHLFQKSDGPTVRDLREQARKLGLPFKDYWHLKKDALIALLKKLTEPKETKKGSARAKTGPLQVKSEPETPAAAGKASAKVSGRGAAKGATPAKDRAIGRIDAKVEGLTDESASSRVQLTPPPTGFREPLEPHDVYIDRGLPLPQTYGQDRITILPRDPHYLFIYWELDGQRSKDARGRGGEWVLRIESLTRSTSFDIYVGGAVSWYLKVSEGEEYLARIGIKHGDGQFFEVAASDARLMPVSLLSQDASETWAVVVRDARKLHRTRAVPYVIAHREAPGVDWHYPGDAERRMMQETEFDEIRMPGGAGTTIIRKKWRVPKGRFTYETPPEPLGSSAMTRYKGAWQVESQGEEIDVIHLLKQQQPTLDVPSSFSGTLQPRPAP
ncbi:MAG TPA: DUF4912 domain-containing protein [Planctomycetota bacterium]|nr:DUF4912 domain-containing protein [Planctomycetota bacterium]